MIGEEIMPAVKFRELIERGLALGEADDLLQVDAINEFAQRCRHPYIG